MVQPNHITDTLKRLEEDNSILRQQNESLIMAKHIERTSLIEEIDALNKKVDKLEAIIKEKDKALDQASALLEDQDKC